LNTPAKIYIVGGGAIGFSIAVHLKAAGRNITVLRVRENPKQESIQKITVQSGDGTFLVQDIITGSLSSCGKIEGLVVLATKANANEYMAAALAENAATIDLVLMQNGIGVEGPFLGRGFRSLSRCVVYITAEKTDQFNCTARMVKSSPIGTIDGKGNLQEIVDLLTTDGLVFHREITIDREVWKKGIINTVFNSVCPLLDIDNGLFERDSVAFELAGQIVEECVPVAKRINISIGVEELLDQILMISKGSTGQLISTLQDIQRNCETEIKFFNYEICRVAGNLNPPIKLPITKTLGLLTLKKSEIGMEKRSGDLKVQPG